jgi:SHAQKYF class myb-like DNA-binding protein
MATAAGAEAREEEGGWSDDLQAVTELPECPLVLEDVVRCAGETPEQESTHLGDAGWGPRVGDKSYLSRWSPRADRVWIRESRQIDEDSSPIERTFHLPASETIEQLLHLSTSAPFGGLDGGSLDGGRSPGAPPPPVESKAPVTKPRRSKSPKKARRASRSKPVVDEDVFCHDAPHPPPNELQQWFPPTLAAHQPAALSEPKGQPEQPLSGTITARTDAGAAHSSASSTPPAPVQAKREFHAHLRTDTADSKADATDSKASASTGLDSAGPPAAKRQCVIDVAPAETSSLPVSEPARAAAAAAEREVQATSVIISNPAAQPQVQAPTAAQASSDTSVEAQRQPRASVPPHVLPQPRAAEPQLVAPQQLSEPAPGSPGSSSPVVAPTDLSPRRRNYPKPKPRKVWTAEEHEAFKDALKLYGRDWAKVTQAVGTKTVQQTRSHAQKHFKRIRRENLPDTIPPPVREVRAAHKPL